MLESFARARVPSSDHEYRNEQPMQINQGLATDDNTWAAMVCSTALLSAISIIGCMLLI
jgi:hypothetical protein